MKSSLSKVCLVHDLPDFYALVRLDWDVTGEMKLDVEQWEVDWDDDNVDDEFSVQLRYSYLVHCKQSNCCDRAELQKAQK